MKNDRSFEKDARNVVGLIRQHLPSAQILWSYGQGREPSAEQLAALQRQQDEEQEEANAEFECFKQEQIKAVADLGRKADTSAIFARAFANVGNADLAEKWAINAFRRRREAIAAAFKIRHLVFTPEELAGLYQSK
jgi:hypothetical protein